MTTRTSNYRFTIDPTNAQDMAKLKALKASLKGTGQRVKCQGRGLKDDKTRQAYKDAYNLWQVRPHVWGASPYSAIKLADAKTWDVYVYMNR